MTLAAANAVSQQKAAARRWAYAEHWQHRPNKQAARHFGVSLRTITRWRQLMRQP